MRIGRGNWGPRIEPSLMPLFHHRSHMTNPGFETRPAAVGGDDSKEWFPIPAWVSSDELYCTTSSTVRNLG
jgi:hypothetical protein